VEFARDVFDSKIVVLEGGKPSGYPVIYLPWVLCHRMGHRLSYRALTAALWLEEVEDGREEREKQL
jgi:hypothetical protein